MTVRRARCVLAAAAILAGLTVAAPAAQAVPSVTFQCTPAPQDCSGWYRTNVTIDWTVLPGRGRSAGCQDKTFTDRHARRRDQRVLPRRGRERSRPRPQS